MKHTHNEISPATLQASMRGYEHMALTKSIARENVNIERANLLEDAKLEGLGIVHIYNVHSPKGGLTVAFRKVSKYTSGVMVEVAVQTCSQEDAFSKKVGTAGALRRFFNGETIQLPLLATYAPEDLNYAVKRAFTALYDEVVV